MDYNAAVTPGTPDESPIQDSVERPTVETPAAKAPTGTMPAATAAARPKGPNASAIIVGLVAMLLAGLVIAKETMGLSVDWSRLGPGAIIGIGIVMVVLGAIGLVRRRDDA
jgi:predicted lipid-binding transport protein (Tim44 family)